jgi:hypothetical protein
MMGGEPSLREERHAAAPACSHAHREIDTHPTMDRGRTVADRGLAGEAKPATEVENQVLELAPLLDGEEFVPKLLLEGGELLLLGSVEAVPCRGYACGVHRTSDPVGRAPGAGNLAGALLCLRINLSDRTYFL